MQTPPKKVLIVRFSSIGDIILCSPIVRCIKKQWKSEIHFITKAKFAGVIRDSHYIDRIITIEDRVHEVSKVLKEENYDLVVDLHKNIRSQQVKMLVKSKYVTFDKLNIEKWLTVHTPLDLLPEKHLVDRYFEGFSKLGLRYDGEGLDHIISEKSQAEARHLVNGKYVAICLGATYATKRMPLEKLKILVSAITLPIVLIGGNDVRALSESLSVSSTSQDFVNLVGKVSIPVSSAILAGSTYAISGDSGMMHIAAAHRIPLIVPWGSTHTKLGMYPFYPTGLDICYVPLSLDLNCQPCSKVGKDTCPKGHFHCMMNMTDGMIKDAVESMESRLNLMLD